MQEKKVSPKETWITFSSGFRIPAYTEVFGSTGFGNTGFSGITDIFAIPKLKFFIKKVRIKEFPGVMDKMAIPTDPLLPKTSVVHFEARKSSITNLILPGESKSLYC